MNMRLFLLPVMLLAFTLILPAPAASRSQEKDNGWDAFVQQFIESYFKANPTAAVDAGRHEFDGLLPDWSKQAIQAEIARLKSERQKALAFSGGQLDQRQRFERDYLVSEIDGSLFWLETAGMPWKNPVFYSGPLNPSVYLTRPYAPLPERMKAFIRFERNLPAAVEHIPQNLETPLPKSFIHIAHISLGGLANYFENDVPKIFAEVKDDKLQADFRQSNQAAAAALKKLDQWFSQQEGQATEDFALGPEKFRQMLKATEGVDTPLDELESVGRRDMDRNLEALKEACAKFVPGVSLRDCMQKADADKPEGSPVEAAREQLHRLKAFVEKKDLVTIPGTEEAKVAEAPPYQRWNFAYINIPGPYEKNLPSVYYIAPPDPSWSEKEREAYLPGKAELLFTSVHEVWPGHFLQFLHANRSKSKFGQLFVGYAFAEGWAHYTEEMMWEAGLGEGDPETHIGQLKEALLRNARFLCAIGMHARGMTQQECEDLFREKAFQDPGNARQQAARGTFDPAYLNYTMGKLMIRKLRQDWTATRGGRKAWKQFHDRFLSFGGPPIPLVRKAMLGRDKDSGSLF